MDLTIDAKRLAKALQRAEGAVNRGGGFTVLECVMVEAHDDGIRVSTSNMRLWYHETLLSDGVAETGTVCVDCRRLRDFAKAAPDGAQMRLRATGSATAVALSAARGRARLPALPPGDFPKAHPERDPAHAATLPGADLRDAIERVRPAVSTEESRYYLCGIYLHADEGGIRAVATNGHVLHTLRLDADTGRWDKGVIVPREALDLIAKACHEDGDVQIEGSGAGLRFSQGPRAVTTRLVDGVFPDYQRVIPPRTDTHLAVDGLALSAAVGRVTPFAGDASRAVCCRAADRALRIACRDEDKIALDAVDLQEAPGEMEDRMFNGAYLMAALKAVGGEVRIGYAGATDPVRIDPLSARDAGTDVTCVVVPMRGGAFPEGLGEG